jgi:membrane protease subunit HflK
VHYNITDLRAFAYNHKNAGQLLQDIATREVVKYLAASDFGEIMARSRQQASADLQKSIQSAVDRLSPSLGVRVNYIGLQDIHPPVTVAPEFQKVVSAAQSRQAQILAAQAGAISNRAASDARAFQLVAEAEAERQRAEVNVGTRAALFTNQVPAYAAAPSVYKQRAYLQTFARATAPARKYIIATTNAQDVIQFDLQDKVRADLLDATVPAKK